MELAEIEVGEYVRNNKGKLGKVLRIEDEWIETTLNEGYLSLASFVTKHSKNIIDLIEVGDYVNGCLVLEVCLHSLNGAWIEIESNKQSSECTLWNDDIKSIITKENFKSMEYRVEE